MSSFSIQLDPAQLAEAQRLLKGMPRAIPKILSRAINRTATTAQGRIVKGIAADVNLKQKDIRRGVTVRRATSTRSEATISIRGRRVPLIGFGARQTNRGVNYKVRRSGGRSRVDHAFISTMKTGHRGVFRRVTKKRLKIIELRGPSIVHVFRQQVADHATRDTSILLAKNVSQQVQLALQRKGGFE